MNSLYKEIIAASLLTMLILLLIVTSVHFIADKRHAVKFKEMCQSYQSQTGRETKYKLRVCYVKHGDSWYTKDEYKFIALEGK